MPLNPSRLVFARARRGMTQSKLAETIGVTPRTIKAYEADMSSPSDPTVEALANALDFPVAFLTATDDLEVLDLETVSFRSLKSLTARRRDAGLAAGALAVELDRWIDSKYSLRRHDIPYDLADTDPELAADSLRRAWGLGNAAVTNVIHLLEIHGIRIFSLVEDCRELDAFSTWRDATPYLFLNTLKSTEHSRMDAAHELGHLVLHREGAPNGRPAEAEANAFAAAFLMPRASVLAAGIRHPNLTSLVVNKKLWGVSVAALVVRLHRVGLISDWTYRSLFMELSKAGYRSNEPDGLPPESSALLAQVLGLMREDGLTLRDVARQIFVPAEELERLMFGLAVVGIPGQRASSKAGKGHLRLV